MINVSKKIAEHNVVVEKYIAEDKYSEEHFNDDEHMRDLIITDKYSLEEVRDFILNEAPYIVINVYNDGEFVGKCSLAEQLYLNQFFIEIDDGIMEIERNGRYEVLEFPSGVWIYEVVEIL